MKFFVRLAAGVLALASVWAFAAERQPPRRTIPAEREARVIVKLRSDATTVRRHALAAGASTASVTAVAQRRADALAAQVGLPLNAGRMLSARAQVVQASGLGSAELAARLARHPEVEYAVPDRRRRSFAVPADPLFAAGPANGKGPTVGQWYLHAPDATMRSAINAQGAWDVVTGKSSIVVAVLDTGVVFDHLDLRGVALPGYDMIDDLDGANDGNGRDADASDPGDWITTAEDGARNGPFQGCGAQDSSWHGTMVSSIIAATADDRIGMAGVAHGVRILPVRVLGKCGGYDSDIVAGMLWAAGLAVPGVPSNPHPARVLNLSLGGDGACDSAYADAVSSISAAPYNALVVAAAGNSEGHAVGAPANCAGVMAVGGLRHAGSKVGFSDLGSEVAISAPAGNCVNTADGAPCLYPILAAANSGTRRPVAGGSTWTDSFNISVGTSFSAPLVAGAAALILSARPELDPQQVRDLLTITARPFPTTGADNGPDDPTPVAMCRVPDGNDQDQCYCTTAVCGAGMLDVAAAVLAAAQRVSPLELGQRLMQFAERNYPAYFPAGAPTRSAEPFLYRYYPSTGAYLGVVVQSSGDFVLNGVYVMGGEFGPQPLLVGRVTDFINPAAASSR